MEVNESPLPGLSNMRAALQAFQLRDNLLRAGCLLEWVASDYDLADALTKKKAESRMSLIKFLRTGYWDIIKHDPQPSGTRSLAKLRLKTSLISFKARTPQLLNFVLGWCNRCL